MAPTEGARRLKLSFMYKYILVYALKSSVYIYIMAKTESVAVKCAEKNIMLTIPTSLKDTTESYYSALKRWIPSAFELLVVGLKK